MNIKIFVIPAMAIIAAELVCTLCNVNTAMKHVSDIKMQAGAIVSATGRNEVASAEVKNGNETDVTNNSTGLQLWRIER